MSEDLEKLWKRAKDLKHDVHRFTDNYSIHDRMNDLIDEIELAISEGEAGDYDYDVYANRDGDVVVRMNDD